MWTVWTAGPARGRAGVRGDAVHRPPPGRAQVAPSVALRSRGTRTWWLGMRWLRRRTCCAQGRWPPRAVHASPPSGSWASACWAQVSMGQGARGHSVLSLHPRVADGPQLSGTRRAAVSPGLISHFPINSLSTKSSFSALELIGQQRVLVNNSGFD